MVPPPPALPVEIEAANVDCSTWKNLSTYLRTKPTMAKSLAQVGRRSKVKPSAKQSDDESMPPEDCCRAETTRETQRPRFAGRMWRPSGFRLGRASRSCSPQQHIDKDADPSKRPWRDDLADTEVMERERCEEIPISYKLLNQRPEEEGSDVTLQVYDLSSWTRASQLPIFHLGVQVYRLEYFFCSRGIQTCMPSANKGHIFRESLRVGKTSLTLRQIRHVVQHLREVWSKNSYRILGRNCQTFAVAFCNELGLQDCVPPEYCRFSEIDDLRTQIAGLVDGAAAMLPRMLEDPGSLLGFSCAVPQRDPSKFCCQTSNRPETPGQISTNSIASPRWFEEESISNPIAIDIDSAFCTCSLPRAAVPLAAKMESKGNGKTFQQLRRRPELGGC
jgi:hypothetical protein